MKKIVALLILLVTAVVFAVVVSHINPKGQNSAIIPTTLPPEPSSYIALSSQDYKSVYRAGEPINILISAHSDNTEIAGFDVSLLYDYDAYQFVSEKKIHPDFDMTVRDVTSADGKHKLIITGTVPVQKSTLPILTNSQLVTLTFIPTQTAPSGPVVFDLEFENGSTKDSNLINSQSQDILSGIKNTPLVTCGAAGKLILTPGVAQDIDNKLNIQIATEPHIPDKGCADCITDVSLDVTDSKTGRKQTLLFESGGIDGRIELLKKAFSHKFEVIDIQSDQVSLCYSEVVE